MAAIPNGGCRIMPEVAQALAEVFIKRECLESGVQ
jgi:hypothetical protein